MTEFYSKYYFQGLRTSFFLKQLVWELIILIFLILMTIVPFLNGKVNFYTISSSIFFLFTIIIGLFGWIDSNFSRESIILGKDKIVLLTKYPFSKNKKVDIVIADTLVITKKKFLFAGPYSDYKTGFINSKEATIKMSQNLIPRTWTAILF